MKWEIFSSYYYESKTTSHSIEIFVAAKTFSEILLEGLAKDGGLYLPEKYPQVTKTELNLFRKMKYADLAYAILKKFEIDIPDKDLKKICNSSHTEKIFKYGRNPKSAKDITPVIKLEKKGNEDQFLY